MARDRAWSSRSPCCPGADAARKPRAARPPFGPIADERDRWRVEARLVEYLHRFGLDEAATRRRLGRREEARGVGAGLRPSPRPAAARRAHEPSRHRRRLARPGGAGAPPAGVHRHHPRPYVPRSRRHAHRRARPRACCARIRATSPPTRAGTDELAAEAVANRKFDQFWEQEEAWIRKGVEARRTRDEGRVRRSRRCAAERARDASGWAT